MNLETMKEADIKILVVRWLLDQLAPGELIASELQFADATSRADLVISSRERLSAFEIKSSYDDFRRFNKQQEAYRLAFLDNYLVVPPELLRQAREHLAKSTGILIVRDDGEVILHRKPYPRRRLRRREALAWLRSSERNRMDDSRISEGELTQLALQSIHTRLSPRFDAFLKERGTNVNSDDLGMLSLATRIR